MIYQVNNYNAEPTYFDELTNSNAKTEAEELLSQNQLIAIANEAARFSICATFIEGNNTTWREVKASDPENTLCQVFDTFTGSYTQCNNKTEAYNLNEQKKLDFLSYIGLNIVTELTEMPKPLNQPISKGTQTL